MRAASSRRTTTVAEMCVRPAHSWLLPLYNAVSNKILWLTMVISSSSGRCCWLLCLVSHWFVTEGAGTTLSRRLLFLRACSCINYRSVESLPTEQNIGRDLAAPMPANTSTEIHEKKEREKKTMRSRKKNYWRWKHVKRKMHTQHSLVIAVHLSFLHISLTKPQPPHWALFFFFWPQPTSVCVCAVPLCPTTSTWLVFRPDFPLAPSHQKEFVCRWAQPFISLRVRLFRFPLLSINPKHRLGSYYL